MADLENIKDVEEEIGFKIPRINFDEIAFENMSSEERSDYKDYQYHKDRYEFYKQNKICYYDKETSEGKRKIVFLQITHTNLKKIPFSIFSLLNLKELNLSHNKITKIPEAIKKIEVLGKLNLSNNELTELPDFLFPYSDTILSSMYSLDFSYNKIEKIPKSFFEDYWNRSSSDSYEFLLKPHEDISLRFEQYYNIKVNIYQNNFKYPPLTSFKDLETDIENYYKIQEEKKTEDVFFNAKNKIELPYAIKSLKVNNYQGLTDISIEKIPLDTKWIFVTGENGYGKTSLLQSIVIGFLGNKDEKNILTETAEIYLEYKNTGDNIVNAISADETSASSSFDFVDKFQLFAAYGPTRLNKNPYPPNDSKTNSLFKSFGQLLDIEDKLGKWKNENSQKEYFTSTIEILKQLLTPQITDIIVRPEGSETLVRYIEFNSNEERKFEELASGYKSIISMVGDIMIRLSKHQEEVKDLKKLAGIVLIDEIDLHLHPKWQKAMVEKLTELFPRIQFIASTHSPIPILGAPKNTVIINVQREEGKGITAEKSTTDFSRLMPNSLLSSPIFNFEELIANSKPNNKFPHTEDEYKEIQEKEKLQNELSKFLTDKKTNELLNLLNAE